MFFFKFAYGTTAILLAGFALFLFNLYPIIKI